MSRAPCGSSYGIGKVLSVGKWMHKFAGELCTPFSYGIHRLVLTHCLAGLSLLLFGDVVGAFMPLRVRLIQQGSIDLETVMNTL